MNDSQGSMTKQRFESADEHAQELDRLGVTWEGGLLLHVAATCALNEEKREGRRKAVADTLAPLRPELRAAADILEGLAAVDADSRTDRVDAEDDALGALQVCLADEGSNPVFVEVSEITQALRMLCDLGRRDALGVEEPLPHRPRDAAKDHFAQSLAAMEQAGVRTSHRAAALAAALWGLDPPIRDQLEERTENWRRLRARLKSRASRMSDKEQRNARLLSSLAPSPVERLLRLRRT